MALLLLDTEKKPDVQFLECLGEDHDKKGWFLQAKVSLSDHSILQDSEQMI